MKAVLRGLLDWLETDASRAPKTKTRAPTGKKNMGKKDERFNRHRSVSVMHAGACCPAVKALTGHRFLAGDAPQLPLANCTLSKQCKCGFRKHDDRRDFEHRRLPDERGKWYGGPEKRRSRGLRSTD